ncbi:MULTISPECIES: NUDIX hydrolase [unclassified Parafrankia]|uniref:NUDIX hydrolase n=1 Tax=unclassified Parafrankia TaxID=2994368 RepID=UPI001F34676C|nr:MULTISPECIES: NUDIX hydrolase [unclassified Parafrankia]
MDDAVLLTTRGTRTARDTRTTRDARTARDATTARDTTPRQPRSSAGARRPEPPALVWYLPGAPLRLGEPARETAVRLAAEIAGLRADEAELTLAHAAHHRLAGEERVSLYFTAHCWDDAVGPGAAGAAQAGESGEGAPEAIQTCWRPLGELQIDLDPLDRTALVHWRRGERYSEPGWHPVRPPTPGGLSPLDALRAR